MTTDWRTRALVKRASAVSARPVSVVVAAAPVDSAPSAHVIWVLMAVALVDSAPSARVVSVATAGASLGVTSAVLSMMFAAWMAAVTPPPLFGRLGSDVNGSEQHRAGGDGGFHRSQSRRAPRPPRRGAVGALDDGHAARRAHDDDVHSVGRPRSGDGDPEVTASTDTELPSYWISPGRCLDTHVRRRLGAHLAARYHSGPRCGRFDAARSVVSILLCPSKVGFDSRFGIVSTGSFLSWSRSCPGAHQRATHGRAAHERARRLGGSRQRLTTGLECGDPAWRWTRDGERGDVRRGGDHDGSE